MSKVSKLHVLALREIVSDTGADRGILLAEHGFQSGALEAAALTNVQITSLADLTVSANKDILSMRLRDTYDRLMQCKDDYWEIPKAVRIEYGLRPEVADVGYSGDWAIKVAEDLVSKGLRGTYPIVPDEMHLHIDEAIIGQSIPKQIDTLNDLLGTVSPIVLALEEKIESCKQEQSENA